MLNIFDDFSEQDPYYCIVFGPTRGNAQGALKVVSDGSWKPAHHHCIRYQRNESESMWLTALDEHG
ncbi:predicted protein [Pyrenophora tritici-repentis Pt-1C-BFP]|uniref:Uncharacterized protein n=1 Tax=Pyrenophora tritici-repentis (strain Pt-1C-BFP) TaxID=426418 RepID=B2VTA4_PYRTR|nr:uncharacterized protein PTRG_00819 [Pyrenophora tritici-repentis Pt-1C-BFP]EDU40257.1 predicted protein [Pyrenophora tritici-repentis Pt-1C-BFP]